MLDLKKPQRIRNEEQDAMKIFDFIGKASPALDRAHFQQFYRESVNPLAAHLRSLGLRNQCELEDIIQETYLEAYKALDSLKDSTKAVSWLLTIGRRAFFRSLRLKKDQRSATHEQLEENALSDDNAPEADDLVHNSGLCSTILADMAAIQDPTRRQVIVMFFLEEASLPEIHTATGIGTSTLTTWISRFRIKVKPKLQPEPFNDEVLTLENGRIAT